MLWFMTILSVQNEEKFLAVQGVRKVCHMGCSILILCVLQNRYYYDQT